MQERAAVVRGGDIGRNRSDADVDSTSNLSREMATQMVAGDEIDRSQLLVCPMLPGMVGESQVSRYVP